MWYNVFKRFYMVYSIVINVSLLIISLCAGIGTLFRHTDFPKGMSYDDIEHYRTVAANYSKTVKGCALTTLISGALFYILVPILCINFKVDSTVTCFVAAVLAFVQMAAVLLVFTTMTDRLNV